MYTAAPHRISIEYFWRYLQKLDLEDLFKRFIELVMSTKLDCLKQDSVVVLHHGGVDPMQDKSQQAGVKSLIRTQNKGMDPPPVYRAPSYSVSPIGGKDLPASW